MSEMIFNLWPTAITMHDRRDALSAGVLTGLDTWQPLAARSSDRFDRAGWHYNVFASSTPGVAALRQAIVDAQAEYVRRFMPDFAKGRDLRIRGWINIYRPGQNIRAHHHPGVHLTAVYYLDDGYGNKPPGGDATRTPGALLFHDPRGPRPWFGETAGDPADGADAPVFALVPRTGMLVVFPGWLVHETVPHDGPRRRIVLSCDTVLTGDLRRYGEPIHLGA
jgi:hypothetical protein